MIDEKLARKAATMRKTLNLNSNKNTKSKFLDEGIQPVLIKFSDIKPEKLDWLWKNRIPMGKVTLLVGDPGLGKSFLTLYMAAHVSTGTPWPDLLNERIEVGSVIILTAEDDLGDTVRIRLEAAGANLDNVVVLDAYKKFASDGTEKQHKLFSLRKDEVSLLLKSTAEVKNAKLIIIDPITAYMGGKNSNSNTDVRAFLAPLAKLATDTGVAIIGVSHLNKNPEISAAYRTLGSIGFVAAARAVWMVAKDPEDEGRRLLLPNKGNLAKEPTGLAFRLDDVEVKTDKGPVASATCRFEPGIVYMTADKALSAEHKMKRGLSALEEAADWLKDQLASGPKAANEIWQQAEADGIAKKTLSRAKKVLGVRSRLEDSGETKRWLWSLLS